MISLFIAAWSIVSGTKSWISIVGEPEREEEVEEGVVEDDDNDEDNERGEDNRANEQSEDNERSEGESRMHSRVEDENERISFLKITRIPILNSRIQVENMINARICNDRICMRNDGTRMENEAFHKKFLMIVINNAF